MSEQAQEFVQQATQAVQNGQFAQALDLIDQALAINPSMGDAYILRGIALAQSQQPDAATAAFRQAIAINPQNPKAYYNLATHLYQRNQKAEAKAMAEESIRLDPTHSAAKDLVALISQEAAQAAAPPQEQAQPYGSPYGAEQPYAPPQSPYYRPGYTQPQHSIAFVENMGSSWPAIAWVIVALGVTSVILMIMIVMPLMELASQPDGFQKMMEQAQAGGTALNLIYNIMHYGGFLAAMVWLIMDIVDRRGNYLWILPMVLCCCCGAHFIPLTLYLLLGRK